MHLVSRLQQTLKWSVEVARNDFKYITGSVGQFFLLSRNIIHH